MTAAGGALVVAVGATVAATTSGGHETLSNAAENGRAVSPQHKAARPAAPLRLVSVTPADRASGVNGASPIRVTFSAKLAADSPLPSLSPRIGGNWQISGDSAVFTPTAGYAPGTRVTVRVPGGIRSAAGEQAGAGGVLAGGHKVRFTTGSYSALRLQQLLAQLGYLPLTWTPASGTTVAATDANAQLSAAYSPPATFSWQGSYPSELTRQWREGASSEIVTGAVEAFQSNQGLTMDGVAGPEVWSHLLKAVAKGANNPNGYSYAVTDQNSPETLTLYHNGRRVLKTFVNTGIAGRGTQDGTFPVYLRYDVTQMKGTNPDGSKYNDTVYYVSYFNGSDAVHYFPRYSYGSNQSLGCVELPLNPAKTAYKYLTYGSLVSVIGPEA